MKITIPQPITLSDGKIMTFQEFVNDILLSDNQFGVKFSDLQIAHQIKTKIANATDRVDLEQPQYQKLLQVMESPTKGYNPIGAMQLMPFFEAIAIATI